MNTSFGPGVHTHKAYEHLFLRFTVNTETLYVTLYMPRKPLQRALTQLSPKCSRPARWLPGPLRPRTWELPARAPARSLVSDGLAINPRPARAAPAPSMVGCMATRTQILHRNVSGQSGSRFMVA